MNEHRKPSVTTVETALGVILCPVGRIDATNADVLERAMQDPLDAGQTVLLFDFTDVDYISSAGLRVLLVARPDSRARGATAEFCGLIEQVKDVFSVGGFDQGFDTFEDQVCLLTKRRRSDATAQVGHRIPVKVCS